MNLALLPGMDGTGLLFEPFLVHAPASFKVTPLSLRQDPHLSYADQAEHILSKLESENTIIVAESYSGRVAYEIAQLQPERIKHIVFAASFLSRPSTLAGIASLLPLQLLKNGFTPSAIIGRVAFLPRQIR
ncbi:alpha/beta fold hydrolase [Microbulbifer taiwanensis]|uniref:Alpha/beta fold hydrolase n=1 Tax=Microbulbifer taiwanensis TaxID=986746 RepID=A0ABW1YIW2_9GAMM|nr:alpha/beta hydrolase [Microbulbifer taiwanensis]